MAQKILIAVLGVIATGAILAALLVGQTKDRRIAELSEQVADLQEGNRRAAGQADRLVEDRVLLEGQTVPRTEHEDLMARYQAALEDAEQARSARGSEVGELHRDLARQREEIAVLRNRLTEALGDLESKRAVLAGMQGDRLEIIEQIVELERFLAEREKQLAGLEDRFDEQDELLLELTRKDREQAERIQKILDRLQNDN